MANEAVAIKTFRDLKAWQEGHKLVVATYEATKHFPHHEAFGLVSQMQRAAVSITSNIAEGFSRETFADKTHFYTMSLGSLTELQNQLLVAKDVGYLTVDTFDELMFQAEQVYKILSGLIRASKERRY